jgi:WD40 repeat protein
MSRQYPATVLRGHVGQVQCLEFCKASGVLVSGDSEGHVRVWDMETARSIKTDAHDCNAGVIQVQEVLDGLVASQGRDGHVKVWHVSQDGSLQATAWLPGSGYHFCKCRAHSNVSSHTLPVPGLTTYDPVGHAFQVWDTATRAIALRVPHSKDYGLSMCCQIDSSNEPILFAGCVTASGAWLRNCMASLL